jgi:putative nucleotidyltransferase with HDIG domain
MPPEGTIRREIEHVQGLPTIPVMLKKLLVAFNDPRLSLNDIAGFVSTDPALTGSLLKAVNSPLFGFSGRVTSITQALLLLGLNAAKGLLLGVAVFGLAKGLEGLWAHSVGTGIVARITARQQALGEPEELFVAGLLHDIGKILLYVKFPDEYRHALALARAEKAFIGDVEKQTFSSTHAEVAGWVLERWHLPPRLIEPIRHHHQPSLAKKTAAETAIVHFSDILTRARGFGSGGDALVPPVDEKVWARLNLSKGDIKAILCESEKLMQEGESFLNSA